MAKKSNGNGGGRADLMVELIGEVRALRKDVNTGFQALIKREDRRWDDHEKRLKAVEDRLGIASPP